MAFFPCVRFSKLAIFHLNGTAKQVKNYSIKDKIEYSRKYHSELSELYDLICKLSIIAESRHIKMVIENPYDVSHYLTRYFPVLPEVIDMDRTERGDWQTKPTQYFFFNFHPYNNFIFEALDYVEHKTHMHRKAEDGKSSKTMRSMIHPQYANRFIREFILEDKE